MTEFVTSSPELDSLLQYVAKRDAKLVHKATAGMGTNDDLLISVLCSRTKAQIASIDNFYREETNGFPLKTVLASEAGGNYGKALTYICQSRAQYLNEKLQVAMSGLGCDKDLVNEIFCLNSFYDIKEMRKIYEQTTDKNLADTLRDWLSGEHEELILSLLLLGRTETEPNEEEAAILAEKLYNKMEKGKSLVGSGLKDKTIRKVCDLLRGQSYEQCALIKDAWDKAGYYSMSLEKTLEAKIGNYCGKACQLLVSGPLDASCAKLKKAFGEIIMDNDTLCRMLAGVDKEEAMRVAVRYREKYDTDLSNEIKNRTGSDFQKVLLTWTSVADPTGGLEDDLLDDDENATEVKIQAAANVLASIADFDADILHYAKEGLGTDERTVVQVLCSRTKKQLDAIDQAYRKKYGPTLKEYCESEMGGNLAQFLAFTQMSEAEFDSYILMDAFSGLGCDKAVVVEVLVTRSYDRIKQAREYFENRTDSNLLDRLRAEMAGPLQRLCIRLLNGPRGGVSDEEFDAAVVAEKIYSSGEGKIGTDENLIVEVFTGHTLEQMKQVMDSYDATYNTSLASAVDSEFSGNLRIALNALLSDAVDTYCRRLKAAQHSTLGTTDEKTINRIIAGNDKKNVFAIAARYFEKYDVELTKAIADKLSGDYQNAVTSYIQRKDPANGLEGTTALRLDEAAAQAAEDERKAREAEEAAHAAELLRAELEVARLTDESAAIEAARQADEERAARQAEERAAAAEAAIAAAEAAAEAERVKQAEVEAQMAAMQERLEAARLAEEAAAAEREALRQQMEAEREAARLAMQAEAEAAAAAIAAAEAEAAAAAAEAVAAAQEDDEDDDSSDESSGSDSDEDEEAKAHRRARRERRGAGRKIDAAARAAKKAAKKDAKKAMKGMKRLGRKMK